MSETDYKALYEQVQKENASLKEQLDRMKECASRNSDGYNFLREGASEKIKILEQENAELKLKVSGIQNLSDLVDKKQQVLIENLKEQLRQAHRAIEFYKTPLYSQKARMGAKIAVLEERLEQERERLVYINYLLEYGSLTFESANVGTYTIKDDFDDIVGQGKTLTEAIDNAMEAKQ